MRDALLAAAVLLWATVPTLAQGLMAMSAQAAPQFINGLSSVAERSNHNLPSCLPGQP